MLHKNNVFQIIHHFLFYRLSLMVPYSFTQWPLTNNHLLDDQFLTSNWLFDWPFCTTTRHHSKRSPHVPATLRNEPSLQPQYLLHAHGAGDCRAGGRLLREAQRDLYLLQPHPGVSSVGAGLSCGCSTAGLLVLYVCRPAFSLHGWLWLPRSSIMMFFHLLRLHVSKDMFVSLNYWRLLWIWISHLLNVSKE